MKTMSKNQKDTLTSYYMEDVQISFTDGFFFTHQNWITDPDPIFISWVDRLRDKRIESTTACRIIERAYKLFIR